MKTKIALAAIISILLISTSHGLQSEKTEFQIQAEKQKAAMDDVLTIAIPLTDFITDGYTYPEQNGSFDENSKIYMTVCPFYMKTLPIKDPWGNNYLIFCGKAGNGQYGLSECVEDDVVIVCLGMDGKKESWEFDFSDPEAGIFKTNALNDFNKDLVNWSGSWIRAPGELLEEIPR